MKRGRARFGNNQNSVFPYETEARLARERTFEQRLGVDRENRLTLLADLLLKNRQQFFEPQQNERMVILAPGVARDAAETGPGLFGQRPLVIAHADGDRRTHAWKSNG